MMLHVRCLGAGVVAAAVWFLISAGTGRADGEKGLREAVRKLADTIEKKKTAEAKKHAVDLAKKFKSMEDVMALMQGRTGDEGGLGVGAKPGSITPDGIEDKVEALAKKPLPEKQLAQEADDLARMGYQVAAVMQVAHAKAPEKDDGDKKRADWFKFVDQTQTTALEFAAVARKKNPAELQKAAKKLDTSCSSCHDVFKK
jgi:hypothetical protein